MTAWSPSQYLKFEDERSRPARNLVAEIPLREARGVVDIGCGPGNSTELLVERFPDAKVTGLDSSPEMLADAAKRLPALDFIQAYVASWVPENPPDILFANAVFQWVPEHAAVLERLLKSLGRGGVLAVQMPDNLMEFSHEAMREVAEGGPWKERFRAPIEREPILKPQAYYDRFKPLSSRVEIWHTLYQHVLESPREIVEWVKGTGLRPFLARLEEGEREAFTRLYEERLKAYYPPLVDGRLMLRFPRIFIVATRA